MNGPRPAGMKWKRTSGRESRYCYDSPLKVFKKSLEDLTSIVGGIVYKRDEGLTRGMQKLRKPNATDPSSRKSPSRNSVIVINDSDSETDGHNDNAGTIDEGEGDVSLSVECRSKPTSPLQRKRKSKTCTDQNTNRSCITVPSDNDSSVLCLSDTQGLLLDGENIAPSQTEDDVVELWSCLKNSLNVNKVKKNASRGKKDVKCNRDQTNAMFRIDTKPNMKYLRFLKTNTEYAWKRNTKQEPSRDKTVVESFVESVEQNTLKHSNSNRRKRKHNSNLESNPAKSNARYSIELEGKAKRTTNSNKNCKTDSKHKLREIIVDSCNVAMAHTNGKEFSEKGIQIVVDYFKLRGHVVKVFLPQHVRKKEYSFLEQLYKEGIVVFTPSRKIGGRQITSYDDRFILKYATSCGGIVISSDQYRDLYREKPEWRNTILNRLLIPTFVGDYIMFPEDPLGKFGPNLERFLRH